MVPAVPPHRCARDLPGRPAGRCTGARCAAPGLRPTSPWHSPTPGYSMAVYQPPTVHTADLARLAHRLYRAPPFLHHSLLVRTTYAPRFCSLALARSPAHSWAAPCTRTLQRPRGPVPTAAPGTR